MKIFSQLVLCCFIQQQRMTLHQPWTISQWVLSYKCWSERDQCKSRLLFFGVIGCDTIKIGGLDFIQCWEAWLCVLFHTNLLRSKAHVFGQTCVNSCRLRLTWPLKREELKRSRTRDARVQLLFPLYKVFFMSNCLCRLVLLPAGWNRWGGGGGGGGVVVALFAKQEFTEFKNLLEELSLMKLQVLILIVWQLLPPFWNINSLVVFSLRPLSQLYVPLYNA